MLHWKAHSQRDVTFKGISALDGTLIFSVLVWQCDGGNRIGIKKRMVGRLKKAEFVRRSKVKARGCGGEDSGESR